MTMQIGQLRVEAPHLDDSHVDKQVLVEGVVKSVSTFRDSARLTLHHCSADFRINPNLAVEARPGENVEVTGTVRAVVGQTARLAVDVLRIRRLPSDMTTFDIRSRNLSEDDLEKWRELAEWAQRRYELYQNPEIGAKARIARENALLAERKRAAGNADGLMRLRDRLRKQPSELDFDFAGLEHEILHAELNDINLHDAASLRKLADRIPERIPFDGESGTAPLDDEEQRQYLENPVSWYLLNRSRRSELARFLQATIRAKANQAECETVLGKPESIRLAERQSAELARYPHLQQAAVRRIIEPLIARAIDLPERDLHRLATLIEGPLGDRARGGSLRAEWLNTQFGRLKQSEQSALERSRRANAAAPLLDAAERLRLAKLWLDWFPGQKAAQHHAAEYLIDAYRINPRLEGVENQLRSLGYRLGSDGVWTAADRDSTGPAAASIPSPAIAVGDKAEKVRDIVGAPAVRTRTVGRDWISHVWQYEGVTYVLREDPRSGYSKVVAIHSRKTRSRPRSAP